MEKAGILKPGIPALVGDGCPVDLLKVRVDTQKRGDGP